MSNTQPDPRTESATAPTSQARDVADNPNQPSDAERRENAATLDNDLAQVMRGSVDDVKDFVGSDSQLATRALAQENASGTPRKTLTSYLEKVATSAN